MSWVVGVVQVCDSVFEFDERLSGFLVLCVGVCRQYCKLRCRIRGLAAVASLRARAVRVLPSGQLTGSHHIWLQTMIAEVTIRLLAFGKVSGMTL